MKGYTLDRIDKKILNVLENNSRISYTALSKAVNLSRPSIVDRINRLLDNNVIEKFGAVFSLKKIGRPVCMFIHISNIKLSVEEMLKLFDRDEIIEVYSVTGENNFILKAATADLDAVETLLMDLMPYGRIVTSLVVAKYDMKRQMVI